MATADSLPPLYARWMDELLGAEIPPERNATCSDCAMVITDGDGATGDHGFSAATKCCTFLPDLWNFLVGRALRDDDPTTARGRATVEARIDAGVAVTPLGLRRPASYQLMYEKSPGLFGHSKAMLCPHYLPEDGGRCGVWRNRESTCTTWFCKFVRGAVGRDFWGELNQLLREIEETLATWCLTQLEIESGTLQRLFRPHRRVFPQRPTPFELDGEADVKDLDAMWGQWRGRERDFYRECARLVDDLSWADVARIGGPELAVYTRLTREAHARLLNDALPERPAIALVQITPRASRARLTTYSSGDALEIPAFVTRIFPYFDGRPLGEALQAIETEENLVVDPSLVRKLVDFGVLRDDAKADVIPRT